MHQHELPLLYHNRPVAEALNHVAYHDARAMAYAALDEVGPVTPGALADFMLEQSDIADCKELAEEYAESLTWYGFAKVRALAGLARFRSKLYAVRQPETMPLVGTLAAWSEAYNFPVIRLLSDPAAGPDAASPLETVRILDGVQNGRQVDEFSVAMARRPLKLNTIIRTERLHRLTDGKVLELVDDPNEIIITDPVYRGPRPLDELPEMAQATYAVLGLAKQVSPAAHWTVGQLRQLAVDYQIVGEPDGGRLHISLSRALSATTPQAFGGAVAKRDLRPRTYRITPDFEEPVKRLVDGIKLADTGSSAEKQAAADLARSYLRDRAALGRIITRGITGLPDSGGR